MAEYLAPLPICILRVDLQCSNCSTKIKNKLQKLDGVSSVEMNKNEGLVLVSGYVDPPTLQKALTKMGKNAQAWLYEKDPIKARYKLYRFIWSMQQEHGDYGQDNSCTKESMNFNKHIPDQEHDHRATLMPSSSCGMGNNNVAPAAGFDQYGQRWVSPRFYSADYHGLPPTNAAATVPYNYMERPYIQIWLSRLSAINLWWITAARAASSVTSVPDSSVKRICCLQQANIQSSGNSIFHIFSDHNIGACTIM